MKKISALSLTIMVSFTMSSVAQDEIKTVFLTTHNDNGSILPILIKKGRTLDANGTEVGTWTNGTRTVDRYMGLVRYDDERLLLGVYSNGINENDPNDNQALAAQFPDRSLIWIDQNTGAPLGIALEIGITPVPLSQAYIDTYASPIPFYTDFDVSDEGFIYVSFGEHILRYKPDGAGGFTGPETVFTLDVATHGTEDWGISTFSVKGSGADTVITGGQRGKGYVITTTNGNTFTLATTYVRAAWPPIGGAQSNIITREDLGEEWVFTAGYGNNSRGDDSTFYRLIRGTGDNTVPFVEDNDFFTAVGKPDAPELEYRANYVGDVAGADNLPYIVVYSTPAWDFSIRQSGAFIALHDVTASADGFVDGEYINDITIPVLSSEEIRIPSATVSESYGIQGNLEVNIPNGAPAGASEILWAGGIYGYGRFFVGNIDLPVRISNWSLF